MERMVRKSITSRALLIAVLLGGCLDKELPLTLPDGNAIPDLRLGELGPDVPGDTGDLPGDGPLDIGDADLSDASDTDLNLSDAEPDLADGDGWLAEVDAELVADLSDIPDQVDAIDLEAGDLPADKWDSQDLAETDTPCVASCEGIDCGDDGCGGDCGACDSLQEECIEGLCVCSPACDGVECGEDGCGGSCGECQGSLDLCLVGACVCVPMCEVM